MTEAITVGYSGGTRTLRVGERFSDDGVTWEIVALKPRETIYSPYGLGGAATVSCKVVAGTPSRWWNDYIKDGICDWCGDSVAARLAAAPAPQTREE